MTRRFSAPRSLTLAMEVLEDRRVLAAQVESELADNLLLANDFLVDADPVDILPDMTTEIVGHIDFSEETGLHLNGDDH